MIDILIDGLVVNEVSWMIDLYSSGDLLRRPSFFEAVSHVLPDEVILKPFMRVGLGLSFTGPSMSPAGCIASSLRRRISGQLTGNRALVSSDSFCDITETVAL